MRRDVFGGWEVILDEVLGKVRKNDLMSKESGIGKKHLHSVLYP